jgi:hypothetical protein
MSEPMPPPPEKKKLTDEEINERYGYGVPVEDKVIPFWRIPWLLVPLVVIPILAVIVLAGVWIFGGDDAPVTPAPDRFPTNEQVDRVAERAGAALHDGHVDLAVQITGALIAENPECQWYPQAGGAPSPRTAGFMIDDWIKRAQANRFGVYVEKFEKGYMWLVIAGRCPVEGG